jgi:class 3 adenylate cyclase/tetratricopeptide (TPR) repeat protein
MVVCPTCGRENPEGFRFCGFCTAPLEPAPAEEREERKVVSVLFVDLVGFTDRSDRADPEDVRATLRPYHARVRKEIERFGGTVEKFVGDAVMAVFGAPVAHEDDAERAVRSALRILGAIEELNEQQHLGLAVRAAVDTGEAVVTLGARPEQGEGIVAGDVVNTAARLQQAAPVGGIVVGDLTRRATRDQIEYEELEPVTVKGKTEPVAIWRVLGARGRYGVAVEQPVATPFIGREDELALLQQTYVRTLRESSVQLVTVTGEPGVGKSRLLAELRQFVDDQPEIISWRQGRCLPYGEGITFWALGEIVKSQAGILESDRPGQAGEKLDAAIGAVVDDAADREWLKTRLSPLVGLTGAEEAQAAAQTELFTAWRRFLEAMAEARPLVAVFDDLHWADEPMLQFIEHLVDWSVDVPLLVVCSARPELYEQAPGWGGGKRNSTTIGVSPLSGEETARLISALLSQAVLPADTQATLLERSGGNPLYAEEFARMLTDQGILERRGRTLRVAGDVEISVPETVQALIAARLDTLSAERKSLLHDAAVIGKVFWAGALADMAGVDEQTVEQGLHELARKELVRPSRVSSVAGQAEFAFWHLLVRDVAYGQIPRAARAGKHQTAAEWIERIAEDRVADHAEVLVYHYAEALELARTAGATKEAARLEEPLRRFLVVAGDRAMGLDVPKAEAYYRRALALLPRGHADEPRTLMKLADSEQASGRVGVEEPMRKFEDASTAFRKQGDMLGAGEAMVRLAFLRRYLGETAEGSAALEEAVVLLEREPPGPELAFAYAAKAGEHMLSGQPHECIEWADKTIAIAEGFGLVEQLVRARNFRGTARFMLDDLGALDDIREAIRLGLEGGIGRPTASAQNNLGDLLWLAESPAAGLEMKQQSIALAKSRGITRFWSRAETCWMLYDLGRWDELLEVADDLLEQDRARGIGQPAVIPAPYKAQVLFQRGALDDADAVVAEFLPRARRIGDPQVLVPALVVAAEVEQAKSASDAALALLDELEGATRDRLIFRALVLLEALRVCIEAGELERGERLVEGVSTTLVRHRNTLLSARAMLAEARGELEEAVRLYTEAAERWAEYGFVLEHGRALVGSSRCLVALGRPGAPGQLEEARKLFKSVGALVLLGQTQALLAQATAASA